MNKLLDKIFKGDTVKPSTIAKKSFMTHFKDAKSIEWSKTENGFEAIFYIKKQEFISKINNEGAIQEYRVNLNPYKIPEKINNPAIEIGEIMNAISIHKPDSETVYELIIRNSQLERFAVLFSADGNLIKKEKL